MKKLLFAVLILALAPALAFAEGAAPYTDEALEKINKATVETPKEDPALAGSREEVHRQRVQFFTKVFAKAGYSFTETIDKIVDDMRNRPESIPKDQDTVYTKIYTLLHILMYECDSDQVDCLKFYPEKTADAIEWFRENSGFTPEHHGGEGK